jgi:hypothetical protein
MPFTAHDAATHAIDRARALLDAARPKKIGTSKDQAIPIPVRGDMRRLSVVMAVAALDTYMHRLIIERVYTHAELPRGLAKLDIPFVELLAQADDSAVAARSTPHNSRPRVAVKRQLRDRLLRETFQRYEHVSQALAMAGRSGGWDDIGRHMVPPMAPEKIRTRLNEIVMRRNQIVHEGDYRRLERPQGATRNGLSTYEARAAIDFIASLITAISRSI